MSTIGLELQQIPELQDVYDDVDKMKDTVAEINSKTDMAERAATNAAHEAADARLAAEHTAHKADEAVDKAQEAIDTAKNAQAQLDEKSSQLDAATERIDGLAETVEKNTDDTKEQLADFRTELDALENASDVVDIVDHYSDLASKKVNDNDIIKVLQDETHNGVTSYYRYSKSTGDWTFVGSVGPYYTESEIDEKLSELGSGAGAMVVNNYAEMCALSDDDIAPGMVIIVAEDENYYDATSWYVVNKEPTPSNIIGLDPMFVPFIKDEWGWPEQKEWFSYDWRTGLYTFIGESRTGASEMGYEHNALTVSYPGLKGPATMRVRTVKGAYNMFAIGDCYNQSSFGNYTSGTMTPCEASQRGKVVGSSWITVKLTPGVSGTALSHAYQTYTNYYFEPGDQIQMEAWYDDTDHRFKYMGTVNIGSKTGVHLMTEYNAYPEDKNVTYDYSYINSKLNSTPVAIGNYAKNSSTGVAIAQSAETSASDAIAIGGYSKCANSSSIALGYYSSTSRSSELSLGQVNTYGRPTRTRLIANVEHAVLPFDAVNRAQLEQFTRGTRLSVYKTYSEMTSSALATDDKATVIVLADETHGGVTTFYRFHKAATELISTGEFKVSGPSAECEGNLITITQDAPSYMSTNYYSFSVTGSQFPEGITVFYKYVGGGSQFQLITWYESSTKNGGYIDGSLRSKYVPRNLQVYFGLPYQGGKGIQFEAYMYHGEYTEQPAENKWEYIGSINAGTSA